MPVIFSLHGKVLSTEGSAFFEEEGGEGEKPAELFPSLDPHIVLFFVNMWYLITAIIYDFGFCKIME